MSIDDLRRAATHADYFTEPAEDYAVLGAIIMMSLVLIFFSLFFQGSDD